MLGSESRTHGRTGRVYRPFVEHGGHVAIHGPGVAAGGGAVVEKVKGQHFALPNDILVQLLMNDHTAV